MNLFDVSALPFEMAASSTTTYHLARDTQFESYSRQVSQLQKRIGDEELDSQWAQVNRDFRRYRYDACRLPVPFNHPYLTSRVDLPAIRKVVGFSEFTRPNLAPVARQCLELLLELAQSDRNPMRDAVASLLASEDADYTIAFILAHSRYLPPARNYYRDMGLETLEVLDQNALRRAASWDRLIVVGSIMDLDDFVFSSPRAPETEVIGYSWHQAKWNATKAFLGGRSGKSSHRQRLSESSQAQMDTLANVDLQAIHDHLLETEAAESGVAPQGTVRVDGRLHELFGGKAAFLEVSNRKVNMIVDLEGEKDDRVRQVADDAIEAGMYVVLRTDNQGGYIIPIANQLIGTRAGAFRRLQANWKSKLRTELGNRGTDGLIGLLTASGSSRANYQNVQNWISPQSIAPESDQDFLAIARVCGLEGRFLEMKSVARELRTAHMNAGQRVRRQLRELVREADPSMIDRQGYQSFDLPELPGAQVTAFRVERRSSKVIPVAASAIERVFDLDVF